MVTAESTAFSAASISAFTTFSRSRFRLRSMQLRRRVRCVRSSILEIV